MLIFSIHIISDFYLHLPFRKHQDTIAYNPAGNRTQAVETFAQASSGSLLAQLTAEARGYASPRLAWPESVIAEEGYHLDRSTDGQNWQRIAELSAGPHHYIDDGLLCHSEYWYRLTAWNSQGQSQEQALSVPEVKVHKIAE